MTVSVPPVSHYISPQALEAVILRAREEDMGPRGIDLTSALMIPSDQPGHASIRSREAGILAGSALLPAIVHAYDPAVRLASVLPDASPLSPGTVAATFTGPLRSILALERVALNFMIHLSGIASLTARFAQQVQGTRARICDTRKTLPGLRALQKYAVACGGGSNHRIGLYDAVLVKDNHIAHLQPADLAAALKRMVMQAREQRPQPAFIEVEVDSLAQLELVLTCSMDYVLLDNMSLEDLREAVAMRDALAPRVLLEASGGVNLQTVRDIALTGVDRISVGSLTHSAASLDLGMDIL